ncbi:flavodoxin family protein [Pseudobacteroides cellulosolvens]|uniref:NADPH-dependent FMN reductase n=1 Tax=Pseudobacteroides cellulosolvens ATCC 35603 = DSM 2933 TaxID=398512 RepID=A0A0L6JUA8_9FIRM|nr:flavodoxin family protein [Pseudobacteroides cellulosolvens]KNY29441.1 NADPH-dependent FMN reductase [Pseudobacteroides cellulosolvens ATCC 35603 = DSM 2933]
MKKILIIEASPRNGFCKSISDDIVKDLAGKYEYEVLTLRNLTINLCKGCAACLIAGSSKCPLRSDDAVKALEKFIWADGIIYVIPNYALSVPANLKNLFDRLSYVFHRPRLFHKVCLPIIVQGVYGGKKIADYVNEVMEFWGMRGIKGIAVTGGVYANKANPSQLLQKDKQLIRSTVEKFLAQTDKAKIKSPSLFKLIIFRMTRAAMKYSNDALLPDKEYYSRMGWGESNYYYDVKLNPFKYTIGVLCDKFAKRMITKGK